MTKTTVAANIETNKPHWIEWATGAVSAVVVLTVIIWIGKDALTDRDTSPDLEGGVLRVEERSHAFQVLFEVRNGSSQTASQVAVRGEVLEGSKLLETAETILDYVPGHSKVVGGLLLQNNPHGKTISIRATSFNMP
ncbi:hypothetical protein ACIQUB_25150 [Rhizobium sp. NPDC090275]|uniref:hypothetical protein n=1 Tax=Rhizobium sp. NPDC090275 TaxID=3364498 RepID=UPI00383B68DE